MTREYSDLQIFLHRTSILSLCELLFQMDVSIFKVVSPKLFAVSVWNLSEKDCSRPRHLAQECFLTRSHFMSYHKLTPHYLKLISWYNYSYKIETRMLLSVFKAFIFYRYEMRKRIRKSFFLYRICSLVWYSVTEIMVTLTCFSDLYSNDSSSCSKALE